MTVHLIISSMKGGGAQRVLALIANNLVEKLNFNISIITLLDPICEFELSPKINFINLCGYNYVPSHTLRSILRLSKLYSKKENKPDLIISFITLTNLITIVVAKMFSIKIMVQEHNSHHRNMRGRKITSLITKQFVYKYADLLTVLTSYDIEYYKKHGINVKVLPNPCSYAPITNNNHSRDKVVLAVGNLNRYHHKGFDNLIHFMAPILKSNSDWKLKIAGGGDEGLTYLKKIAKEQNISSEQIIFTGFVKNISEHMFNSSIFILPSRFEGLPMVLLEAMSQGTSCIAYDCVTGPSDIIQHNRNGLLIEDQNHKKMQIQLKKLMKDSDLRLRLTQEGIKSLERFHIDNVSKEYLCLIEEVLV